MIKKRLREPSTWAGLGVILASAAAMPTPASPWLLALSGMAGGVAVLLREDKSDAQK